MGIYISETRGYKEIPPVLICQFYCFLKLRNIATAQFQRREANPLQLKLITFFTKGEITAAPMQQKFSHVIS